MDVKKFSYPGPKPFTRETAVVMMADSVEAASRSLKQINDKTLDKLVESIINTQLVEEQFNDADITFRDIYQHKGSIQETAENYLPCPDCLPGISRDTGYQRPLISITSTFLCFAGSKVKRISSTSLFSKKFVRKTV